MLLAASGGRFHILDWLYEGTAISGVCTNYYDPFVDPIEEAPPTPRFVQESRIAKLLSTSCLGDSDEWYTLDFSRILSIHTVFLLLFFVLFHVCGF